MIDETYGYDNPNWEEFLDRVKGEFFKFSPHVVDASNIIYHEKVAKRNLSDWTEENNLKCSHKARKIAD